MPVGKVMLMRTRWYPRPHDMRHSWFMSMEVANQDATNYPIAMYDEGLGNPGSYNANPEHASFAETGGPNVYPESRINLMVSQFDVSLTKGTLVTDNIDTVRFGYMPIFMAFKEDYIAIDELSSTETQDVLDMQTESTDRQGYPGWNNTKMTEKYSNSSLLDAAVPGLTTTQKLEGVTFSAANYYDALHYMTIQGKLKMIQGGLKWIVLTRDRPHVKIKMRLRGKTKRANPYMYFGCLFNLPQVDTAQQFAVSGDTTAISHLSINAHTRYNEWQQGFDFDRV